MPKKIKLFRKMSAWPLMLHDDMDVVCPVCLNAGTLILACVGEMRLQEVVKV